MTPRTTITALLVATCAIAACGGDDDVSSTAGDPAGEATEGDSSEATEEDGSDGTGRGGDDGTGATGDAATSTSAPGDTAPGDTEPSTGGTERGPSGLLVPPPDPEPNDAEPPDASWMLLRAFGVAEAGASGGEWIGFDPIWFTDMNPGGRSLMDVAAGTGLEDDFDTVAGCSILQTADGLIIAQASFHHSTDRNLYSSFSMSDNGDGTIVWGLYDAATGEEWSATGPGSATIKYARLEDPLGGWDFLGLDEQSDDLYVVIDFTGEASENFTTDKSTASSRVLCHFVKRPR